jgi:hypothetical protein
MKNAFVITCLLIISVAASENTSFAQKKSCTCKEVAGRTCSAEVICTNGCSAICGRKNTCYVSCSNRLMGPDLNLDFVQKTAEEMAATLASQSRLRLSFKVNPRNANERYDYKLASSDIYKLLEFLDERGTLAVNGADFSEYRKLKKLVKAGGRIARVMFNSIPVQEAVEKLELMTGEDLRIVSGDPARRITVSVKSRSLADILKVIRKKSRVHIAVGT